MDAPHGFASDLAARAARLVRLRLLLPDVATLRDLDDPDEISAVARQVGDVATLNGLYLRSLADPRALPVGRCPGRRGP